MEELLLTLDDAANYRALQRLLNDTPIRFMNGHKRPKSHTKSAAFRLKRVTEQNFVCPDCNKLIRVDKPTSKRYATMDHVIPYRYGGSANRHNVEYVCFGCNDNRNKRDKCLQAVIRRYGTIGLDNQEENRMHVGDSPGPLFDKLLSR